MSIKSHRYNTPSKLDDDERSEGELDSSLSDNDDDDRDNDIPLKAIPQPQHISQSWSKMLTDENLSSIMSNALADNSEIIHIDDPIAQQSTNPLTYVFPPGTNVDQYFRKKKKQNEANSKRKPNRRDLKNLSRLLNNEKNDELLSAILDIVGCRRAFQYAHEAVRLFNTNDETIKKSDNGQIRTLGGVYFKMFIKDIDNDFLSESERDQIKKRNQEIQKLKKKKKPKKKKTQNKTIDFRLNISMHSINYIIICFVLGFYYLSANQNDFNPYDVLGVSRTASDKEIRQAYKKLAKHWHPDKNSEPNANDKFTKINAAYEILSDSTKRQQYDEHGTTSQDNHQGFSNHPFQDPFDIFRSHFFHEASSGAKKVIHAHEFLANILPNSDKKPYLIFGSTNFCFNCRQALQTFRALEKQLNDVGIGTGEFNANDDRITRQLGVLDVPALCVISQGRVYHFDGLHFTESNIKEFVRKSIPIRRYIPTLENYDDVLRMITSYNKSNRVHALLITKQKIPTLKFVLPCLQYSARIQCASFNSSLIKNIPLSSFLKQVSTISDTVLLFKEDSKKPEFILKDNGLTFDNIIKTFESNQLLHLPTITSANVFHLACQSNSNKPCFLIIGDSTLFAQYRLSLLHLSKQVYEEYNSHIAYLDSSSTQQAAFQEIVSPYYQKHEKKLVILAARRWLQDSIEIQNTNIEFDKQSLIEIERDMISIKENFKLFVSNRWPQSKKYKLPVLFDFDDRRQDILTRTMDQVKNKWNYWIERNQIPRY
ncbi:unnamed protein product, partial [Rotaria socialis]